MLLRCSHMPNAIIPRPTVQVSPVTVPHLLRGWPIGHFEITRKVKLITRQQDNSEIIDMK